jgi:hypothetical protein
MLLAASQTTSQSVAHEDGTNQVQYWDTTNVQPWSTAILHYDATGHLTLMQGVYDNGTTLSFCAGVGLVQGRASINAQHRPARFVDNTYFKTSGTCNLSENGPPIGLVYG